jgi:hypothetical protein
VRIVKNKHDDTILKNNPYPTRFVGVFFFVISSMFVYGGLGGYSNYRDGDPLIMKLHALFGMIGVSLGVWLILTKSSYVKISAATQTVNIIKSNLLGKNETSIPFYKIKEFIVSDKFDQDGDLIWKVDLELESDEIIELTDVWINDKPQCEEAANSGNLLLHKPAIAPQT